MRNAVAVLLAMGIVGCQPKATPVSRDADLFPLYCEECRAIRVLAAKPNLTAAEMQEMDKLGKKAVETMAARAAFDSMGGDGPRHIYCDCPCHRRVR